MCRVIEETQGYEYKQWYVKGTNWNGMVTKIDGQAFKCDCTQYKNHKWCQHISHVQKALL